jgi:integrase
MKWADVDLETGIWTIPKEPREKANAGVLRLPPYALGILKKIDRVEGCPYVFVGRYGKDKHFNSFSACKAELDKKLPDDMEPWRGHDLRRTARTLFSDLGVNDRTAEQVLGHAVQGVEKVYNRSQYLEQKSDALLKLASYIQNLVEPAGGNLVAIAGRARRKSKSTAGADAAG